MRDRLDSDGERITRWVRRLSGGDEARRVHAAMRLSSPGLDLSPVMPALQEALRDADPQVRKLAAYVLGQVGKERDAI